MCISKLLGLFQKPEPQPLYPNELPPTLTQEQVIAELEYDILIHESWAGYVTEYPSYAETMGDYSWHLRWIDVYKAAIYYIETNDSMLPPYDRLSCYSRRADL